MNIIPFQSPFAEQTRRLDQQNQNQNAKSNRIPVGRGNVTGNQRLGDPDDDAAQRRTGQIADAAENRRHKRLESGQNAHERINRRIADGIENPRRRRQRRTKGKGERDDHIGVDAHQGRRLRIERQRAHGCANFGFQGDEPQGQQQQQGHAEHNDLVAVDAQSAKLGDGIYRNEVGEFFRGGTEEQLTAVFEEQRNPDGGDEHGQFGTAPQRPVGQPFNNNADGRANRHGNSHDDESGPDGRSGHNSRDFWRKIKSGERTQHKNVAVGKVDETENSIDHRVAKRNQGENRAEGQAVDELLD